MNNQRSDISAADQQIKKSQNRNSLLKGGVNTIIAGASALGASSKILPFLSSYLTPDMAMKGINKIAPEVGKFLQNGMKSGLSLKSGLEYLRQNAVPKEAKEVEENAQESRNIIEQYSPELNQFIQEQIGKGLDPIQAGAIAQNDKRFSSVIQKLMKDHKTPWSNILQAVFGQGQQASGQAQQNPTNEGNAQQSMQGQQQQQPNQGIDPQLAQILQQGNALLQKFRGA